jgi:hypothetical protein
MASAELWGGLCGVCCGPLTVGNTLAVDTGNGRGGVHRGRCAYLRGEAAPEHQELLDFFGDTLRLLDYKDPARGQVLRLYWKWLDSLGIENHFNDDTLD